MANSAMDLQAFGRLVEAHYPAVSAVAYAVTRDLELAEDVAQETFVAAWTTLDRLRDPARIRPWLCGIARNQARSALRRRGRETPFEEDAMAAAPADSEHDREELANALAALSARYREALVLFYWDDQSIHQVASMLAISEPAAQKRISRARSLLKASLVERLETTGRANKRASAAAAVAVLALITTRGVAHAAPTKGLAMSTWIASSLVVATGSIVLAVSVSHGGHADAPHAPAPVAVSHATHAAPVLAPSPAAHASVAGGPGVPAGKNTFGTPSAYELTVLAPTSVAIDLAGGASSTYLFQQPPAPTFDRHVRGRVIDEHGHGVAGAAVVIGDSITSQFGALMASEGAMSGDNGAFDITTHRETAQIAIALHARGWSAPLPIAASHGDTNGVVIALDAPGTLAIHTRQGGAPREADVRIAQPGLALSLETDGHGDFELPRLAPGTYHVRASAMQQFADGTAPPAERDVVVTAGQVTEVELDLRSGTLVVVTPTHSAPLMTIEYFLSPGTDRLPLDELTKRARTGQVMDTLFGGHDLDNAMQFHDVVPGTHTLCIDARVTRDQHLPLDCRTIEVPADKPVLELDVTLGS